MIVFPNGTLRYADGTAQDLDEKGFPIPAELAGGTNECRCTITTVTEDRNAVYDGGAYIQARYSVKCDMDDVGEGFNPSNVTLVHEQKGDLGAFQVIRIEYYTITRTIEIWV